MHPIFDEESIPSVSYPTKGNRGVEKGGCLGWRFQLAIFYTETETFAQKARDIDSSVILTGGKREHYLSAPKTSRIPPYHWRSFV